MLYRPLNVKSENTINVPPAKAVKAGEASITGQTKVALASAWSGERLAKPLSASIANGILGFGERN
jgi:hypothetical protein